MHYTEVQRERENKKEKSGKLWKKEGRDMRKTKGLHTPSNCSFNIEMTLWQAAGEDGVRELQ